MVLRPVRMRQRVEKHSAPFSPPLAGFLGRLIHDRAGNTLAVIAAALLPLLALVGGGVDLGRGYLVESRLQQACDAGVLAARKRLGSESAVTGDISDDVADTGQRFFNINFRDGSYGSVERSFTMFLEDDFAISGEAAVDLPTSVMKVFGHDKIAIAVDCMAQINFSHTDVMMVLDTTGSMGRTNAGDSQSRIDVLKETVLSFHAQLDAASQAGSRIRYGFVPYSTNVNVLHLLKDEWVVPEWAYQSRKLGIAKIEKDKTYETGWSEIGGTRSESQIDSYAASYSELNGYYCPTKPADELDSTEKKTGTVTEAVLGPPPGTKKTETIERTRNGTGYDARLSGTTCNVFAVSYTDYVDQFKRITEPTLDVEPKWTYAQYLYDVSDFRTASNGCIEERETYEIDDYDNVDLDRALDLNLDLVPGTDTRFTNGGLLDDLLDFAMSFVSDDDDDDDDDGKAKKSKTSLSYDSSKWRPMYPERIFLRQLKWDGSGKFDDKEKSTKDEYMDPVGLGTAACPAPARKLAPMTKDELETYLGTLEARGNTYHDIGMIWGGRLLSPDGIFAAENADQGSPTARNLIFLTDGQTAPLDIAYSSYGAEPLDQRRWSPKSDLSLTETVEQRFLFTCGEVRKKNITVWVIGFGTELTDLMKQCAGPGHYFEAADATELNSSFATIAETIADLRIIQ